MALFCRLLIHVVVFFTDWRLPFSVVRTHPYRRRAVSHFVWRESLLSSPQLYFSFPALETSASSASSVHVHLGLHMHGHVFDKDAVGVCADHSGV